MSTAVIVLAAGSGRRVGAERNKVLLELDGTPILVHSIRTALALPDVLRIAVVVRPEDRVEVAAALSPYLGDRDVWLVDGGVERHDSEARAITALAADIESGAVTTIAIHDAARPLASAALFEAVIAAAATHGAAVPAVPTGQLSTLSGARAESGLVAVQTPQAFRASELVKAFEAATADGFIGTDTAASVERYAELKIHVVPGEATNLKVTFPEDVAYAEELLKKAKG